MGHNAGWLALGAGIAGGADVILIPEIPYDPLKVAQAIRERQQRGTNFSIVAVAEGAVSVNEQSKIVALKEKKAEAKEAGDTKTSKSIGEKLKTFCATLTNNTLRLTNQLEQLTGLESRLTILGHLQRGGTPSAADRVLATRLGSACVEYFEQGVKGCMIAVRGEGTEPVPLEKVVGKRLTVPLDHSWVTSARNVNTCFGD